MTTDKVREYIEAKQAVQVAAIILHAHDYSELVRAIGTSNSLGPTLDPTAWREAASTLEVDKELFEAAARFMAVARKHKLLPEGA